MKENSTLKMEAGCASEALVPISLRIRRNTPDDRTLEILATRHILHRGETHGRQVFSEDDTRHLISLIALHSQYNWNYETTEHEMGRTCGMYLEEKFKEGFGWET
jgi:uncharacterized protein (DUF2249 family)